MQFSKLRLIGFKSFVDPTELEIQPGLTGVVGPNGCGKSNLVEALKWVMGETSAKQMRGGEMDDVIFAGSQNRPARNIAEVALAVDNSERNAPSQFNETDDLEVTRKIEREKGSIYRVNAKEVRARDVHLLFADAASGARSTALVSQGQIGEVVSAKPSERRKLLEEAAGISGLHSRRHEAELRLRGAETNLERLDDIMAGLESQLLSLRKQVRQAKRYRNLNSHIEKAEATMFQILWMDASVAHAKSKKTLSSAEAAVVETTGLASAASVKQELAARFLPELREKEAAAAAALQRLNLARENLEEDKVRLEAQKKECESRLLQVEQDIERERILSEDADTAVKNLEEEKLRVVDIEQDQKNNIIEAKEQLEKIKNEYESKEESLEKLTLKLADQEAHRNNLDRHRAETESRLTRLRLNENKLKEEIAQLKINAVDVSVIEAAEKELTLATNKLEASRDQVELAESSRINAAQLLNDVQIQAQETLSKTVKLEAEIQALSELAEAKDQELWPPLIDSIIVEPGLERALGMALGEDLNASTDENAPIHWQHLPEIIPGTPLPEGAEPLSNFVKGPEALINRLSQIGVVTDATIGRRLVAQLKQGQRLITREGAFWRWDGFSSTAEAPTPAAMRLEQINRLTNARAELKSLQKENDPSQTNIDSAREFVETSEKTEQMARISVRKAEIIRDKTQERLTQLHKETLENNTRLESHIDVAGNAAAEIAEVEKSLSGIIQNEKILSDLKEERQAVISLRVITNQKRDALVEAQSKFDLLHSQTEERKNRLQVVNTQITNWYHRKEEAEIQLNERSDRKRTLEAEKKHLTKQPEIIRNRYQEILDKLEEAEIGRKNAADSLTEAETKLANAVRELREIELKLGGIREERVRAEAAVTHTNQVSSTLIDRMTERLDCRPAQLHEISGINEELDLPLQEKAEKRVERLLRERENMGPVNLLADSENKELSEQIETLTSEREDLIKAISKLRRGINELNREGRQRLLKSFEQINKHFQNLFVRLFGGGKAHLELIESDDPLEAGLEIMASPPGKRLQVLSLLSGGEQALTALSLLFAVFMCNPAPICVLDEVDAPLDDANVDRFCSMVDEMAHNLSTRFLVVTHHRMTMARMDRLFGVTMGEQGVSQLVSVDLGEAIELRDIA